ncbi:NAD(P)H-dependent oxidoreductase [Paenibacillus sp. SC116]|uniref:NAD(P)H-dependent oxidoreductase n=1 Tax=Paenibacillus sp. SC116 TaxID=2968986 RepID=UPI00215B267D|nr:NAD(P)H-dependent oxidoreductase [Paenibacillus sp. SC116]MCR8842105.1 NAD(P)H-dependent oxidoreductase [Paenibacillus sp. SC116]
MKPFIVFAHHEPQSFCGALKDTAIDLFTERGYETKLSDLYQMAFKPVADWSDFQTPQNPDYLKYGAEQRHAYEHDNLSPDIILEHNKLTEADLVIFIFPLWWHSVPAILKGWFDRVLVPGFAYGRNQTFANGLLKGKRAMLVFTTGAEPERYEDENDLGILEYHLHGIEHGTLKYVGMDIVPYFAAWQPAHVSVEKRVEYLQQFRERLIAVIEESEQ